MHACKVVLRTTLHACAKQGYQDYHPLGDHASAKRLIKGKALACKGRALDYFPLGNHGFPLGNNQAHFVVSFLCSYFSKKKYEHTSLKSSILKEAYAFFLFLLRKNNRPMVSLVGF